MNKQELGNLISELQSAHNDMNDTQTFDIGVCDINDNYYDLDVTVNRMDINGNCKMADGTPYPAELMLSLDECFTIEYEREEEEV